MAGLIEKFPEKERDIVRHLGDNVSVLINKGCYNHSLVHTVIFNYIQVRQRIVHTYIIYIFLFVCYDLALLTSLFLPMSSYAPFVNAKLHDLECSVVLSSLGS